MCTTVRAAAFIAVFNGKKNSRVGVPEFLARLGTGKRQVSAAYLNPVLRVCIFQAFILGVGAMSQKPSPQKE
jgi:hypothetical protein